MVVMMRERGQAAALGPAKMMTMVAGLLALAGCAGRPEPVREPVPDPVREMRPAPVEPRYAPYDESSFRMPKKDSGASDPWPKGLLVTCERQKEKIDERKKELEEAEVADVAYVRERCHGTLKREVWLNPRGRRAPERAWVCDGKIVDKLESARTQRAYERVVDAEYNYEKYCR